MSVQKQVEVDLSLPGATKAVAPLKLDKESFLLRLRRGLNKALDRRDAHDSVDSKYTIEVDEKVGRLDLAEGVEPRILMPVAKFDREPMCYPPPQCYDFITGMEAMRDGGPTPDWSGCGAVMPFRGKIGGDGLRHKYSLTLAETVPVQLLVNPGQTELYNFPKTPVYYSHREPWHVEQVNRLREEGRLIVTDNVDSYLCLVSMDTIEQPLPKRYVMLVPHPASFLTRQTFSAAEVDWDGKRLLYTWNSRSFHKVSLVPAEHTYLSTRQLDKFLGRTERAYWLYFGGYEFDVVQEPGYKVSYSQAVSYRESKYTIVGGSVPGSTMVDLDAEIMEKEESYIQIIDSTAKLLLPKPRMDTTDDIVCYVPTYQLPVGDIRPPGQMLRGKIDSVPVVKSGKNWVPILDTDKPTIIFGSYEELGKQFVSLLQADYPRRVKYIGPKISALNISSCLSQTQRFSEFMKLMKNLYGSLTTEQLIVALRHSGGMLSRYEHDRYVTKPTLPGIEDGVRAWLRINSSSVTEISFDRAMSRYQLQQWFYVLTRNRLESYWDRNRQLLIIHDPYQESGTLYRLHLELSPSQSHLLSRTLPHHPIAIRKVKVRYRDHNYYVVLARSAVISDLVADVLSQVKHAGEVSVSRAGNTLCFDQKPPRMVDFYDI